MENGYWETGTRAKTGAYETIDNVTKFALSEDDYEYYEEWVEYTEEELAEHAAQEESVVKKMKQEAFLENAPDRLGLMESCVAALTSAFGEVN